MVLRRRRILRVAGLALAGSAAGCLGGRDSTEGSGGTTVGTTTVRQTTTTRSPTETTSPPSTDGTPTVSVSSLGATRTVFGDPVTVTKVAVRDSVVYAPYPDELGVTYADGGRYVLARVEAPVGRPDRNDFELVAGDRRYSYDFPYTHTGIQGVGRDEAGRVYGSDTTAPGWLAFAVPAPLEGGPVRIRAGDKAWTVPERYVERLRRPTPTFELVDVSIPETVAVGGTLDVGATVRNAGVHAGTFRGMFVATGAGFPCCVSHPAIVEVPAGATRGADVTFGEGIESLPSEGRIQVRFKSSAGDRAGTVTARRPTTTGDG